ncbi:MAG: hypothetical protein BJ554DRAFT_4072 [Olpidium bornovanus]|uniref:Uncharacterized protein n=1 Tax=Olpidium bornovanus TaxID=278681 RepID=A0A8H7ZMU4_9FUNG|nr:MAG: hypothetical protein BJ554DRAFT_4072 [Olpidium bornovanus]
MAAPSDAGGWKFAQCFGDKGDVDDITEADIISTVEFDHTGDYLATGDKGGRVVLFERNEGKKCCEYKFHAEFQSHEPEFDYLKSLEIEEKINKIKWCRRQNSSHFLLSTNGAKSGPGPFPPSPPPYFADVLTARAFPPLPLAELLRGRFPPPR